MGMSCTKVGDSYVVEPRRPHRSGSASMGSWKANFVTREDVHTMLVQLQRDQPEDLEAWMKRYPFADCSYPMRPSQNSSQGTAKLTPLHRSATGTMAMMLTEDVRKFQEGDQIRLDWRYYMFNAEKEVLESSRNMVRKQMERGYMFRAPSANIGNQFYSFLPQTIMKAIETDDITREDTYKVMSQALVHNTYNSYNPIKGEFEAVVVMMDASGFTALTEKLAMSKNGAEEIGACLNTFFAPLIELVVNFGGDILKFSGDALTILWPISDAPPSGSLKSPIGSKTRPSSKGGPPDAFSPAAKMAYLASCCCLEVQRRMPKIGQTPLPDVKLTLHIGVGMGPLKILQLGGVMNRWEYCAVGPPLEEVAEAEPLAKSGEIVVSDSVAKALLGCPMKSHFKISAVAGQAQSANPYMLVTANASLAPEDAKNRFVPPPQDTIAPSLPRQMAERYIPHACLRTLRVGNTQQAEVRQISVVFLQLQKIDPGRDPSKAVQVQLVMRLLQRSCYALEGSVNKFLVDDKGMLLLTVFGLPPLNHYTDDPLRAAMAAVRFCDTLREEDLAGRAGVATGKCWCGVVGSKLRREYTVLGDTVNTSARLMAAADDNKVLVDSATQQACEKQLTFDRTLEVAAKGKTEKLKVYEFTGTMKVQSSPDKRNIDTILLGWDDWPTKRDIEGALEAQLGHNGGTVYVRGGPGKGKKEVFTAVKIWGRKKGFKVLRGENMNHVNTFPMQMLCWQEVFRDVAKTAFLDPYWQSRMELECNDNAAPTLTPGVLFRLLYTMLLEGGADQDLLAWAPLLSIVFPTLDFGQKLVQAMLERDEQHSFDKSRLAELCVKVMDSYCTFGAGSSGTVACLHMLTSTSFFQEADIHTAQICRAMVNLSMQRTASSARGPFIFCVISRHGLLPDDVLTEKASACGGLVTLSDLSLLETKAYVLRYLAKKKNLPDLMDIEQVLVVHLYRVSGGNLFAIRELAEQLWRKEVFQFKAGKIRAARGWSDPIRLQNQDELPYPDRLLGHTIAQFEKLSPEDQSVIRHAAVYCQETSQDSVWTFTAKNIDSFLTEDERIDVGGVGKIEERLDLLVEDGILAGDAEGWDVVKFKSEGPPSNVVGEGVVAVPSTPASEYSNNMDNTKKYIFVSQLMRHVASMFILDSEVKTWANTISQNPSRGHIRSLRGIHRFLVPVPTPSPTNTP